MNIVIFFIILLVLVLVHEFGHFFTAKKFGIRVEEFGFGFPPKLFSIKRGETEYSFNLLPLGGFVKIFGDSPNEVLASNSEDKKRSFVYKPKYQQALVLFAGIFANLLLAWFLFSIGFMSGLPTSASSGITKHKLQDVNLVIVSVAPDSPAKTSGLKSGDKIISLQSDDGKVLEINPDTLKAFVISHENKEIEIGYMRKKETEVGYAKVTPVRNTAGGAPAIGIAMDEIGIAKLPFFSAFYEGLRFTAFISKETTVGLYTLIKESLQGRGDFSSVVGPVGLVGIVGDAYNFGFVYLMTFTALISINLAIINLIPFPALDGGRLLFLLIEKIKGSPINPKIANSLNMVGFTLLILFMLVVTYHDIIKLF